MAGDDYSIILWKPPYEKPEDGSSVLLKLADQECGIICSDAAYENGKFIYVYNTTRHMEFNSEEILG
ncbi:MAG: hypothetical protein Q4E65_10095 [Clostridia bacterium]|nr:hypothetical protein [Clostridia bacterium]